MISGISRLRALGAIVSAIALVALVGCAGEEQPERQPHVVILMIDALRADRLGVNGYSKPLTPNIDLLAAEGVTFDHFYSHSTWTKPSIATLFTSLYPPQHGIDTVGTDEGEVFVSQVLARSFDTLAEHFRRAGYATAAVISQPHLRKKFGFGQGFDSYHQVRGDRGEKVERGFRAWLGQRPEGPVFAYLHFLDVHWPYKFVLEETDRFGSTRMERPPPNHWTRVPEWLAEGLSQEDLSALIARYDNEVRWADHLVARVVAQLQEHGLWEDAIVVVTSDHGEGFLEHGLLQHSYDPYNEVTHIPLVIRLPEWMRGDVERVDHVAGLVDLMPTLLELSGLELPEDLVGQSLVPAMEGRRLGRGWAYHQHSKNVALRDRTHKLILFEDGSREFYSLVEDPREERPIAGPCEGPCAQLDSKLASLLAHLEATRRLPGQTGKAQVDESDIEELKALGYL